MAGTADYFKGLLNDSQVVYVITAILASGLGVLVGQLDFNSIIVVAIPVLLFIYPITIVLILLNVLPEKFATPLVFRAVVIITFVFSIPDVVGFISPTEDLKIFTNYIPFSNQSLGWVLPAFVAFLISVFVQFKLKRAE